MSQYGQVHYQKDVYLSSYASLDPLEAFVLIVIFFIHLAILPTFSRPRTKVFAMLMHVPIIVLVFERTIESLSLTVAWGIFIFVPFVLTFLERGVMLGTLVVGFTVLMGVGRVRIRGLGESVVV